MILGIYYSRDIVKKLYNKEFWKDILLYAVGAATIVAICFAGSILFNSTIIIILFDVTLSTIEYGLILIGLRNKFALDALENIMMRIK
ncbi:hypothetical protein lacNasYZ03_18180 [Lactobacillus nasalidis]|uniref:Uncharacterized protein n=2 Tax=Lactobacillus nasalidis TaxID=2797258 RepID=A0ABQ3W6E4_9LACO|nr:hypothetical protein lacNasYZ01_12420 [Lactobacillus nasalidis]GHV99699.1 hypothetical protein lacNasYZ02_11290 [Lactobacillus nasalidis]GHW02131.1 hypothetical protein lacNasYZ03_18180 [Lactobacillus nasalidis]